MTKQELSQILPEVEGVYLIFSKLTRSPYVECDPETFEDEVIIFLNENEATACAEQMEKHEIPVIAGKVSKQNMLRMFAELFPIGVNNIRFFVGGEESLIVGLEEVVKRPPLEEVPENVRPIENPQLSLSMLYFMQEARNKKENKDLDKIHELEEEMIANVYRSSYILPTKDAEVEGQQAVKFMLVKMQDGTQMVPIFPDTVSFANFVGKEAEVKGIVLSPKKLLDINLPPEASGYVISPAGACLAMTKEYLEAIVKSFEMSDEEEENEE